MNASFRSRVMTDHNANIKLQKGRYHDAIYENWKNTTQYTILFMDICINKSNDRWRTYMIAYNNGEGKTMGTTSLLVKNFYLKDLKQVTKCLQLSYFGDGYTGYGIKYKMYPFLYLWNITLKMKEHCELWHTTLVDKWHLEEESESFMRTRVKVLFNGINK